MKKSNSLILLRVSYWIGAVLDLFVACSMVFPSLFSEIYGLKNIDGPSSLRAVMGMCASFMIGWSALLIWADRKPVERKGILVITVFPVIVGMAGSILHGVASGFIPFERAVISLIIQGMLIVLFLYSYFSSINTGYSAERIS
ncbi:MAG: hypothetical protein JSV25_03510 [Spirochaetota bacterium]|nr:MAG: hypothetical protein JSV25_03510 [Spirochaetota bacterium]